jgi:hypothetical protein
MISEYRQLESTGGFRYLGPIAEIDTSEDRDMKRDYKTLSALRVRPALHKAIKVAAAMDGKTVADLADEIFARAMEERQETTRMRARKVTRLRSPD